MLSDLGFLAVVGFATFRLWRLLAVDNVTASSRSRLGSGFLGFLACPWCAGFWLSVIVVLVLWRWGDIEWVQIVTMIFAVSGLVGLLAAWTGSD